MISFAAVQWTVVYSSSGTGPSCGVTVETSIGDCQSRCLQSTTCGCQALTFASGWASKHCTLYPHLHDVHPISSYAMNDYWYYTDDGKY